MNNWWSSESWITGFGRNDNLLGDDMCDNVPMRSVESGCKVAAVTKGTTVHGHTEAVYLNKMLKREKFYSRGQFIGTRYQKAVNTSMARWTWAQQRLRDKSGISKVVVWF